MAACPNTKIVLSRRDKATLLCGGLPKPQNRPISARQGDFALWWPAQTPKSSYLGEIRRFCFVVACPSPKIVLSRRDKAILLVVACPNPKIVLSRRDKAILLCGGLPKPQNRPVSGEIRRFCFVVACPSPKIVLSRRDKVILLVVACPNPKNRPISAR